MELVDAPQYAPATCCLTSQGGPLIDTYRQVAQFGHAYLHPDVVREAAHALGMVEELPPSPQMADLLAELEAKSAELEALAEKYDNLRGALAELQQHGMSVDRRGIIRFRLYKSGDRLVKD